MSERSVIEAQIEKKNSEIQSLEERLKTAKVYVKALEDILKVLDKQAHVPSEAKVTLRKGSLVDRTRDVIMARGAPVHIDDLLEALGREVTRETKASLTGSIAAYVRKEEIFTRPAPSTFGLIELGHFEIEDEEDEPPQGFGSGPSSIDDEIPF